MSKSPKTSSSVKVFGNPLLDVDEEADNDLDAGADHHETNAAEMIAANETDMTEDELADLTHAFQAADTDGGGAIDKEEFATMLAVMGCDISMEQVTKVIDDAKHGFSAWKKMADEANVAKCQKVWKEYDDDNSGTMDLKEINRVIAELNALGSSLPLFTARSFEEKFGEDMDFDEFSAWFLKQEGLPDAFAAPQETGTPALAKKKGFVGKSIGAALTPFQAGAKLALGPVQLLAKSASMAAQMVMGEDGENEDGETTEKYGDAAQLNFAEYIFLIRGGALQEFMPDDWQERAQDMRKLREAFDTADVDGDNQLELEELEMVILSMNAKADIQPTDVARVWEVLNPEKKSWIPFAEFVAGMIKVKRDPELSAILPMDVPNRFQLLSLLIDPPVNDEEEKRLLSKLTFLERIGIEVLERIRKPPPSRDEIRDKLGAACAGELHCLNEKQRKAVNRLHWSCVLQACCIGTFCTVGPGLFENFLVWEYETDGVLDAYWTCSARVGDPTLAPWGVGDLALPQCKPGLCTSVPENATEYLAMGGNALAGGTWIDGDGPCPLKGIPPEKVCDDDCTGLKQTWTHSPEAVVTFWVLNVLGIVTGIVFELTLLMYTAVRSSVKVSHALDLRLTPLNSDRAFVANMLVRAAFEMGDPEGEVMGVEAKAEVEGGGRHPLLNVLAVMFIKGKVVLTGTLFKQVTAKVAPYDVATWIKPYTGTTLACAMWDSMMCHAIMKGAELRALGITTGVEVFNEILDTFCPNYESDPASLSEAARVQMLRGIGVAIVKHGSMFPTMEMMLRHAVNYLDMKKSAAVRGHGIIDDEDGLLEDFGHLTLDESRAVLCIHMLCYVLDGSIGLSELSLWTKLLAKVEERYQEQLARFEALTAAELREYIVDHRPCLARAVERVPTDDPEVEMVELREISKAVPQPENATKRSMGLVPRVICQKFRNNVPVTAKMLQACYDPQEMDSFMANSLTPDELSKFTFNEFTYRVMSILTKQI